MKHSIVIIIITLITSTTAQTQTLNATTDKGEKVKLNSNGTWDYEENSKKYEEFSYDTSACSKWIEIVDKDKNGDKFATMKDFLIISKDRAANGFGINLILSRKIIILNVTTRVNSEYVCVEKGAKLEILFSDSTKIELKSIEDTNCKGKAKVIFDGNFADNIHLNEILSKKIGSIRVWINNNFVEHKFEELQSYQFNNVLKCLTL
jgi:hypothetical protein